MSNNLDIFNLDAEAFVTKAITSGDKDDFYKPYPEDGKDGVYTSLIRFVPNAENPEKSKIHKFYVFLKDPVTGDSYTADCPSTVGKKSILKDLYWKLKNSHSAADQELSKSFSRKEDFYAIVQVIEDKHRPELEGKMVIFKFGKKINDLIEAQIKPTYGETCNPFDLFDGRELSLKVRKVGDWNNYDLCSFVGDKGKSPIKVGGKPMQKTKEDMASIIAYVNEGPKNLLSYEYKDWDDTLNDKIITTIKNSVPEQRVVNEILGGVSNARTQPAAVVTERASTPTSSQDIYSSSTETSYDKDVAAPAPAVSNTSSSLEDLYGDL
jgi:hypothetical protein